MAGTNNDLNISLVGQTGTGTFVGSTSPTFVTPTLTSAITTQSITFTSTSSIIGSSTNDSAATGSVGEFVSSTILIAGAAPISSGSSSVVTTITIGGGDWDVWAVVWFEAMSTTVVSNYLAGLGTAGLNGTPAVGASIQEFNGITTAAGTTFNVYISPTRFSNASSTTIQLLANAIFSVNQLAAYGTIMARRIR